MPRLEPLISTPPPPWSGASFHVSIGSAPFGSHIPPASTGPDAAPRAVTTLAQVSSALIARHESWVRQQARSLIRRLPSNVERADLIQVGLIAVAHSAVTFRWPEGRADGDADVAFIAYAKKRVRGAMLDELRQMDQLTRVQRRKVKALQIFRERWHSLRGQPPTLAELSAHCHLSLEEVVRLEAIAASIVDIGPEREMDEEFAPSRHPCTAADEVEARVDTEIVLRRLARIWPDLPERDRRVIDAYLGIGLAPVQLAQEMKVSVARVSQWHRSAVDLIAQRVGTKPSRRGGLRTPIPMGQPEDALAWLARAHPTARSDGTPARGRPDTAEIDCRVAAREAELAGAPDHAPWSEMVQRALWVARRYANLKATVPSGP